MGLFGSPNLEQCGFHVSQNTKIIVPSQQTIWETAAVVELAGRIGLHSSHLKIPIFENMFSVNEPIFANAASSLHLVLGYELSWLEQIVGEKAKALRGLRDGYPKDTGLLFVIRGRKEGQEPEGLHGDAERSGVFETLRPRGANLHPETLVITGTSPAGVLHAARFLASEGFGQGLPFLDGESFAVPSLESADFRDPALPAKFEESDIHRASSGTAHSVGRKGFSLHNLFTHEGIYHADTHGVDTSVDFLLEVGFCGMNEFQAYAELAARICLSATAVCFPITHCPDELSSRRMPEMTIQFQWDKSFSLEQSQCLLQEDGGNCRLRLIANPTGILNAVRGIMKDWFEPLDYHYNSWRSRTAELLSPSPDIRVRAELGALVFERLSQMPQPLGDVKARIPEHVFSPTELWTEYLQLDADSLVKGTKSVILEKLTAEPSWTAHWRDEGELAEIEEFILDSMGHLRDGIHGRNVTIEVATTVSGSSFWRWVEALKQRLRREYNQEAEIEFRDANKSGLRWALSTVLPQLKIIAGICRIQLRAREFTPMTPHLDLKHRYLQEMYPFDAILAKELNLSLDSIELQLDSNDGAMFQVEAYAEDGKRLGFWAWDGWSDSVEYMPQHPELGCVAIPSAGVRFYALPHSMQDGPQARELMGRSAPIPINAFRFWRWYQSTVLPDVIANVSDITGAPKFLRLDCNVWMDAEDIRLPFEEESTSLLEALHEDIYFYTLHFMHEYGNTHGDSTWDAPGAVLPWIHTDSVGAPHAEVRLYPIASAQSILLEATDGSFVEEVSVADPEVFSNLRIVGALTEGGERVLTLAGISDESLLQSCQAWLESAPAFSFAGVDKRESTLGAGVRDKVFANTDVASWLAGCTNIPGFSTGLDVSYQGQWIHLVELFDSRHRGNNVATDRVKHALYKPTLYLSARHHANEVSSTNAALSLIDKVRNNVGLLDFLNIVLVPLENVDGAETHFAMMTEHPTWKLHAARYNACGLEFAQWRFQPHAPFGESRIHEKVWARWKPDVVVDDHGIPSHEWIQPFSGYNSPPRFPVSYWIPQAQMYTIWRRLAQATPSREALYVSLRDFVTHSLRTDAKVEAGNQLWLNMYRRWGNQFAPQAYPIQLSNGNLAYEWEVSPDPSSTNLIERFPDLVTADLITEVNDETVHGDALRDCAHAHSVVHSSIIEWMARSPVEVTMTANRVDDGGVKIALRRQRPMAAPSLD